jgi:hypothetical protein
LSKGGRWALKDVDECEDLRRRGGIGNDDHEAVERAKPTVVAAIESDRFPSDGCLIEWQWRAGLPVGVLPDAWDRC